MNDAPTLQDVRTYAKQWVWARMSDRARLNASHKIFDDANVPIGDTRRAGLGLFSWGPANPGSLNDHCEGLLYTWVAALARRVADVKVSQGSDAEVVNAELQLNDLALADALIESAIAFVAAQLPPTHEELNETRKVEA